MPLRLTIAIMTVAVALASFGAPKGGAVVRPTGTFTSLKFNEEGGDLLGVEVKIVPSVRGFQAAVLVSEGEPSRMVVVDVTVSGRAISFSVPAEPGGGDEWRFSGTVSTGELKGAITYSSGRKEPVTLQRRCGYWDH